MILVRAPIGSRGDGGRVIWTEGSRTGAPRNSFSIMTASRANK